LSLFFDDGTGWATMTTLGCGQLVWAIEAEPALWQRRFRGLTELRPLKGVLVGGSRRLIGSQWTHPRHNSILLQDYLLVQGHAKGSLVCPTFGSLTLFYFKAFGEPHRCPRQGGFNERPKSGRE